jgi:hypothetical protein
MDTAEKVREARVRRMLARQGYTLSRSRRRDPLASDYGHYTISKDGVVVFGAAIGRSLDDAAAWALSKDAPPAPDAWEEIGEVAVDSGRLMLADPAYHGQMTVGFVNADPSESNPAVLRNRHGLALAMVVGDFGGDGVFPVTVTRTKGGRITALRVDFTPEYDVR